MSKIQDKWADITGGTSNPEFDTAVGDGSTVAYNTSNTIANANTVRVYLNGLLRKESLYTVTLPTTVTFNTAPATAVDIYITYEK